MTPCSPLSLFSFLTLSSWRLPMCSRGHIGYFSISGNSQGPLCCPLFPHHISSSFHCLCSFHLFIEPNLVIHSLIQWVLSAWLFICLHFAVLSAEVLSICPNRQNTGSLFILNHYLPRESWLSTDLLFQHWASHSCSHIYSHPRQPQLSARSLRYPVEFLTTNGVIEESLDRFVCSKGVTIYTGIVYIQIIKHNEVEDK